MEVLFDTFEFIDSPAPGDRWTTELSLRHFIETHRELRVLRGAPGATSGDDRWLAEAVHAGLQRYGCETFSKLYVDLLGRIDDLVCEALHDSVLAMQVCLERPGARVQLEQRERVMIAQILDDEIGVASYVAGPMLGLRHQSIISRLRTFYALRGARLGRALPFSVSAPQILEAAFSSDTFVIDFLAMKERVARTADAVTLACRSFARRDLAQLYRALFIDVMEGVGHKISTCRAFQRFVISGWVLPEVDRRLVLRRLAMEDLAEVQVGAARRVSASRSSQSDRSGLQPW